MEYKWVVVRMVMMLILLKGGSWKSDGCSDHERDALLHLKSVLAPYIGNPSLPSWEVSADCCSWKRVVCSTTTQRVTQLYLDEIRDDYDAKDWYLNASLFLPFQQLTSLDLEGNNIAGCMKNEGFGKLSTLVNLEDLQLSYNKFTNNILSSMAGLSSLKTLDLSGNLLEGTLHIEDLEALSNVEDLDLSANKIEKFMSRRGDENLLKLKNLEYLSLDNNNFNNSILLSLKELSSLTGLSIGYNQLKGSFNLTDFEALTNLMELSLSQNKIDQFISRTGNENLLKELPSLKFLDIQYNQFKGSFNLTELENLNNLKQLDLSGNEIDRFIPETDFKGLSNLTILYLRNITTTNGRSNLLQSLAAFPHLNMLDLRASNFMQVTFGLPIPSNLQYLYLQESIFDTSLLESIGNMTSLETLSLRYSTLIDMVLPSEGGLCKLKYIKELDISSMGLHGSLPWCLANLTSLQNLDLSSNHFNGSINLSILGKLTSMSVLILSNNSLRIPISLSPFLNLSKLTYLDSGDNQIFKETKEQHMIPKFQLKTLYLSGYGYGGVFPEFLKHQQELENVGLSNIKFGERFPHWLLDNNTNLQQLFLANSSLSGSFRLPIYPHWNLFSLDISDNSFHGSIPTQIGAYFPRLTFLSMSGNQLTGRIQNLSNCTSLQFLDISRNKISGQFSDWLGNFSTLLVLDLSENNISGSLPSNFDLPNLAQVYLARNNIQGSLENAFFSHSYQVMVLDLSHNHLMGRIPSWIGGLFQLGYLLLGHNQLEGRLPFQLCNLKWLNFIDLSHNYLSGDILQCIKCKDSFDKSYFYIEGQVELTLKGKSYFYEQWIATHISGMDFSSNHFIGNIPLEIGNLDEIKFLNLSFNYLTGPIPSTFFNLSQIESLDLSFNNLQGSIPFGLIKLNFLAAFNISYNNLSGRIPEGQQFATFDESSYLGNPFLYGCPLPRNCSSRETHPLISTPLIHNLEVEGFMDMEGFFVSFGVAYVMVLLGIASVLYINPYWRRVWFYYAEASIENCYYFIIDNILGPLSMFKFRSLAFAT